MWLLWRIHHSMYMSMIFLLSQVSLLLNHPRFILTSTAAFFAPTFLKVCKPHVKLKHMEHWKNHIIRNCWLVVVCHHKPRVLLCNISKRLLDCNVCSIITFACPKKLLQGTSMCRDGILKSIVETAPQASYTVPTSCAILLIVLCGAWYVGTKNEWWCCLEEIELCRLFIP